MLADAQPGPCSVIPLVAVADVDRDSGLGEAIGLQMSFSGLVAAADRRHYHYAATIPENDIWPRQPHQGRNLGLHRQQQQKRNYRNMARFVRQHIGAKRLFITPAGKRAVAFRTCSATWTKTSHSKQMRTMKYLREQREFIGRKPQNRSRDGLNGLQRQPGQHRQPDRIAAKRGNEHLSICQHRQRLTFANQLTRPSPAPGAWSPAEPTRPNRVAEETELRSSRRSMLENAGGVGKRPDGDVRDSCLGIVVPELDGAICTPACERSGTGRRGIYITGPFPNG